MKMKSTNTVRRNIRRKKIGKYLTKAVKNQTEASLENLASQANRQVYPAANRNLNRVVRVGFIIKREKKLSLSSGRNYETDSDWKTQNMTKSCLKKSNKNNCIVHELKAVERCKRIDLITLQQSCFQIKNTNNHCLHHDYVDTIFKYKILFFENIMAALQGYVNDHVQFDTNMQLVVQQLLHNSAITEEAANIYVEFLKKYRKFINLENATEMIPTVLHGMKYQRSFSILNPFQCHGIDLATGYCCDRVGQYHFWHCELHRTLHRFHKLFTHEGDPGDGFHWRSIAAVLKNVPNVKEGLIQKQIEQLSNLPQCLSSYMSAVTRFEDEAISQFPDFGKLFYGLKIWTTSKYRRNNANKSYKYSGCICQCVTDDFYQRLRIIRSNIDANVLLEKPYSFSVINPKK